MTGARLRALMVLVLSAIAAAALGIAAIRRERAWVPTKANHPPLLLLTSLPLLFDEEFSLSGSTGVVVRKLEIRYRLVPISVADGAELAKGRLLLMAHPPAQTAGNLVVLDEWVRRGGRVVLLADPLLEWPSKLQLGDPLRPPPMFMDTGLLAHWGLRLDAPDMRGPAVRKLGGSPVLTVSPGSLHGACEISSDRLVAHCRVGEGRATIIADADFLDVDRLGEGSGRNLDGLLAELARIDSR
jgi:hypothetical protein